MNEPPDDHMRALHDRFTDAAAKLGPPISPSVADIQRLGLRRRHRRLGMTAAVTSAAAAVVAIALVTSVFGTSAGPVRPATTPTPKVTPTAVTPTPAQTAVTPTQVPSAVRSAVESPSPSAGLTSAAASSPVSSAAAEDFGTFVTPGPIWQTGMGVDGVTLYSSTTGHFVRTLATGREFFAVEPVRHAQRGQWVYFVQTVEPSSSPFVPGVPQLMRVPRGGGTPELLANLTDTQCGASGCYALTDDATRIAYVTAEGLGLGRTIQVRSLANKGSTAVSIALARSEQPIGWLPDDHTLVLESKTTVDEINVDKPGANPVTVFQFTAASATCAASSLAALPAATFDDGTIAVVGCADGPPRQLVNRITPDHAVHPISLGKYATWSVTALYAVDGATPTIILEAVPPGAPGTRCPSVLQVQDDRPRIIASPPTSC
jgi:hypothetical protein